MATEWVFIGGVMKWVQVDTPNRYGKWSVQLYPDAAGLEKLRELQAEGMKNNIKKDDDGWFVRFNRPTQLQLRSGKLIGLTAPELLDGRPERKLEDGSCPPLRGVSVGNGSKGVVKLEVYQHPVPNSDKKAKAARLFGIRVDDLIPFERGHMSEDSQHAAQGLDDAPEALF